MKIYIITRVPFPNGMATVKRIMDYAKGWESKGVDCEVLVYTRTERFGIPPRNTVGQGTFEGVKFSYIKGTPLREKNILLRVFNDYYDRIRLVKYLKKNLKEGDLVYAYNNADLQSKKIIDAVHACGAKYAQELCELPFGTSIEDASSIRKRKRFEREIMPKLDGVISISDALIDYSKEYCRQTCHIVKIPILVDIEKYAMDDMSSDQQIPYIFHCGTLSQQKDGILDMLKAFGKACNDLSFNVRFYSTGKIEDSRHEAEIRKILSDYKLHDKVVFLGYLSDEDIKGYLSKAQLVIINKLTTQQNVYCFSTKLGEYMAASKPIIITNVGEAMNWLKHNWDSYIIEPDNIEALSESIIKLLLDHKLCNKLGRQAQQTCIENFSIQANAEKLREFAMSL